MFLRSGCALLVLLFILQPGSAQEKDGVPTETVITLTVDAQSQPTPALRYQLLPELREMSPGNPVQAYLNCFSEQNLFFYSKEAAEERDKYAEMPLQGLPAALADYGGAALRRVDEAARLERPDWQVLLKLRKHGVMLLVPEVQQMRTLAWAVQVRMRGQIKAGRFDDAVGSATTMLAMAQHLNEHPTLIAGLVGLAITSRTVPVLEEMVQQQGSPNLFWALVNLPRPFLSLRRGWQSERFILIGEFEPFIPSDRPMSEAEITGVYERIKHTVKAAFIDQGAEIAPYDPRAIVKERLENKGYLGAAKKRLLEAGAKESVLTTMPAEQIAMLDGMRNLEIMRDEMLKWFNLPYHQADAGLAEAETSMRARAKREKLLEFDLTMSMPIFSFRRLVEARTRVDARLALLTHVEALRLHASAHGRWPASLKDINLPLPADPYTGRPVQYQVEGDVAHLKLSLPAHLRVAGTNVRYEIVLRK
jgi:hypothetical protein